MLQDVDELFNSAIAPIILLLFALFRYFPTCGTAIADIIVIMATTRITSTRVKPF